jgi:putative oxidoreductase
MLKLRNRASWGQWVPLPLRLIIGFGFMAHGWAKLSRGPSGFAKLLAQIGAPLPEVTAWVSTFTEILGGLAIFVGAFVEVVSVPLIAMMLVAMFTVHLKYGFSSVNTIGLTEAGPKFGPPGYEVNLLYIAGLVALILGGAGALSVDHLLSRTSRLSDPVHRASSRAIELPDTRRPQAAPAGPGRGRLHGRGHLRDPGRLLLVQPLEQLP